MLVPEQFKICSSSMWEAVSDSIAEEAHLSLFWQTLLQLKCLSGVCWARKTDKSPVLQYCQLDLAPLMHKRESRAVASSNLLWLILL